MNRITSILLTFTIAIAAVAADSVPSGFSRPLLWRAGAELSPAWVPGTNSFLDGGNEMGKHISSSLSVNIRADLSFDKTTREGLLYKGLYQGIGLGTTTFFANRLLGTPVSAYVYQGAPFLYFNNRLSLGYEWQFGAAFGWKHYNQETASDNAVIGTSVTAHMALGLKLQYTLSDRWQMSVGLSANHYSNGNTSWPNGGVNHIGASIGIAYAINTPTETAAAPDRSLTEEADKGRWFYDITVYGAWRKRAVSIGNPAEPQLCPGKFGVAGFQFSPLRSLNRWIAVGPSLDFQWDESAGLAPYWVDGTFADMIKFRRPPFGRQISVGLSAHAELTMPIFAVNAGIGYDIVNPKGDKAFYQSLTLKTFITKNLYINTGYRLGSFKEPQNLMLGIGIRL
ncbi:MAG: acyloxyacyl hydrolase [Muribaculaceae bacterium]|nr:acyloxyacyl hydrolase [Muribaculaceae bacterium]